MLETVGLANRTVRLQLMKRVRPRLRLLKRNRWLQLVMKSRSDPSKGPDRETSFEFSVVNQFRLGSLNFNARRTDLRRRAGSMNVIPSAVRGTIQKHKESRQGHRDHELENSKNYVVMLILRVQTRGKIY
jgi:hypothetical protein